jgi:hypothetical protein
MGWPNADGYMRREPLQRIGRHIGIALASKAKQRNSFIGQ